MNGPCGWVGGSGWQERGTRVREAAGFWLEPPWGGLIPERSSDTGLGLCDWRNSCRNSISFVFMTKRTLPGARKNPAHQHHDRGWVQSLDSFLLPLCFRLIYFILRTGLPTVSQLFQPPISAKRCTVPIFGSQMTHRKGNVIGNILPLINHWLKS